MDTNHLPPRLHYAWGHHVFVDRQANGYCMLLLTYAGKSLNFFARLGSKKLLWCGMIFMYLKSRLDRIPMGKKHPTKTGCLISG
jgi:hypothetical protein